MGQRQQSSGIGVVSQMRYSVRATVCALSVLTIVGGCSQHAPSTGPEGRPTHADAAAAYELPNNIGYTYNWASPSNIQLTSPAAIVVRAFVESMLITMRSDMQAGYPGYASLVSKLPNLNFDGNGEAIVNIEGTLYANLTRLDQSADGLWHAGVCAWAGATAIKDDEGFSTDMGTANLYPRPISIDLAPPPADQPSGTGSGIGPARAPGSDVFRGWSVPAAELASTVDRQTCSDLTPARLPAQYQSHEPQRFDQPPPTLPPTPGWPAST